MTIPPKKQLRRAAKIEKTMADRHTNQAAVFFKNNQ